MFSVQCSVYSVQCAKFGIIFSPKGECNNERTSTSGLRLRLGRLHLNLISRLFHCQVIWLFATVISKSSDEVLLFFDRRCCRFGLLPNFLRCLFNRKKYCGPKTLWFVCGTIIKISIEYDERPCFWRGE